MSDQNNGSAEQANRNFQIGDTIGGTYCILSHLGRGGMGFVYAVEHLMLRQTYALKVLTADSPSGTSWRRFQTEARAIARLDHPNIIKVHNLGIHNERVPYYVMDLLEGETLSSLVRRQGRLSTSDAVDMFVPLCHGLAYAHSRGIVHRDIKPSNIMLIVQNEKVVPKLVDFGLVKLVGGDALSPSQQLTASGEVFGSPLYMSPEQSVGRHINERTDIYSLGCTLFQALSGAPPFVGENVVQTILKHQNETPPTLREASMGLAFSAEWEAVLARALAKEADDRYQTMEAFANDLLAVKAGLRLKNSDINGDGDLFNSAQIERLKQGEVINLQSDQGLDQSEIASFVDRERQQNKRRNIVIATVGVAAVALASAATGALFIARQPPQKVAHVDTFTDGSVQPSTPAVVLANDQDKDLENTSKPFLQNKGGLIDNQKIYQFPQQSIGTLEITYLPPRKMLSKDAVGRVKITSGGAVTFKAGKICGLHPKIFRRFQPGDLLAIQFLEPTQDTDDELYFLNHLTDLKILNLEGTDVTAAGLKTIGAMPSLNVLSLGYTKIDGADLATLQNLPQFLMIDFRAGKNATPLIKALLHAPKFYDLSLERCQLSVEDIKLLAKIPNLEKLNIVNCGLSGDALAPLAKCKQLKHLFVNDNDISPSFIDQFKNCKDLAELEISTASWSAADKERFDDIFFGRAKIR